MKAFNKRLLAVTKSRGFKNFDSLAKAMDSNPGTLYNNLKYLSEHRNYHSNFVKRLCTALRISGKELEALLSSPNEIKSYSHYIDSDNSKTSFRTELEGSAVEGLINLIQSLAEGDVFTQTFNCNPYIFENTQYQMSVAEGIKRGVKFDYLYFEENEETYRFLRLGRFTYDNFYEQYVSFYVALKEIICIEKSSMDASQILKHGILEAKTKDDFFSSPLHNYIIIQGKYGVSSVWEESYVDQKRMDGKIETVSFRYQLPLLSAYFLFAKIEKLKQGSVNNLKHALVVANEIDDNCDNFGNVISYEEDKTSITAEDIGAADIKSEMGNIGNVIADKATEDNKEGFFSKLIRKKPKK